jgi:hypothetical protein
MKADHLNRSLGRIAAILFLGLPVTSWGNLTEADAAFVKQDYYAAFLGYLPLAKSGDAAAQAAIGRIYLEGKGAPRDSRTAAISYEKAAEQGYASAQFQLAKMVGSGVGVKADPARAAQLMEKSADQGVVWAMYSVGLMYKDGTGVEKDVVQAHKWMSLAASTPEAPVAAEYIALAKAAKKELESVMNPEQVKDAERLSTGWLAAKRTRDNQWQKLINHPVPLSAPAGPADAQAAPAAATDQKRDESTRLTKDYFPKS